MASQAVMSTADVITLCEGVRAVVRNVRAKGIARVEAEHRAASALKKWALKSHFESELWDAKHAGEHARRLAGKLEQAAMGAQTMLVDVHELDHLLSWANE